MEWVKATDENGNDFSALVHNVNPPDEEHVDCWVFIDGKNGWGDNVGSVNLHQLKKLGDGKFGA